MTARTVIITADDLGLWPEVNDAVMAGYDAGIITSASLRVGARASDAARNSAAMRPGLGVGLHLVLCEGQATMPRKHISDLVDSGGNLPGQPMEAAWLFRRGGGLREQLKTEIRGQIEKFLASGLFMTHISGHHHLHLHHNFPQLNNLRSIDKILLFLPLYLHYNHQDIDLHKFLRQIHKLLFDFGNLQDQDNP